MTMKPSSLLSFAAAIALAAPALAQEAISPPAPSADGAQKISVLVTFGDEPCPESGGDEIIVCAQKPESERYRVPKALREEGQGKKTNPGRPRGAAGEDYEHTVASVGRPHRSCHAGPYWSPRRLPTALPASYVQRRAPERTPH